LLFVVVVYRSNNFIVGLTNVSPVVRKPTIGATPSVVSILVLYPPEQLSVWIVVTACRVQICHRSSAAG